MKLRNATWEWFETFQDNMFDECGEMVNTKGREYANSDANRFENFDALARELGLTPAQVGYIYCAKHLRSIAQFLRTGETHSEESIRGRFVDAITYLTLIAGMLEWAELQRGNAQSEAVGALMGNLDEHVETQLSTEELDNASELIADPTIDLAGPEQGFLERFLTMVGGNRK